MTSGDDLLFYSVYNYFKNKNFRQKGSSKFYPGDDDDDGDDGDGEYSKFYPCNDDGGDDDDEYMKVIIFINWWWARYIILFVLLAGDGCDPYIEYYKSKFPSSVI